MTTQPLTTRALTRSTGIDLHRAVPRWGAFNLRLVGIELRRALRNLRTVIFTTIMPLVFYFAFGRISGDQVGVGNYAAYSSVHFALYAAMTAATVIGASVSVERAQGWSRQLRLTPLTSTAYISVKVVSAMVVAAVPVVVMTVVAALSGARMPLGHWILAGVLAWLLGGSMATLGLFVGYLVPTENAMQILGPGLAILAMGGGLFYPLFLMPHAVQLAASFTPLWGIAQIVTWPVVGGAGDWHWILSAVLWVGLFSAGAAWRFSRDTART